MQTAITSDNNDKMLMLNKFKILLSYSLNTIQKTHAFCKYGSDFFGAYIFILFFSVLTYELENFQALVTLCWNYAYYA